MDKEIEKEFDEMTRKQANEGNPYWPDWEAVKKWIDKTHISKKQLAEEIEKYICSFCDYEVNDVLEELKTKLLKDEK